MSTPERRTPPVGEEIHLPGPSLQPLLLAVGITVTLVGVTTAFFLVIVGVILILGVLFVWIRDARREFEHLPTEHRH
jgi:hypothetical protein